MDGVLADIREAGKSAPNRKPSKENLISLVDLSTRNYLRKNQVESYGFDAVKIGETLALRDEEIKLQSSSLKKSVADSITGSISFSVKQQEYLKAIINLLGTSVSPTDLSKDLEILNQNAIKELGEKDAAIVLISSSLADNSAQYWLAQGEEWISAIREYYGMTPNALRKVGLSWFSWGSVAKNDLAGGVGGATAAVVTGCAEVSLGACAAGGALAGAAGASAFDAALQVLNHYF